MHYVLGSFVFIGIRINYFIPKVGVSSPDTINYRPDGYKLLFCLTVTLWQLQIGLVSVVGVTQSPPQSYSSMVLYLIGEQRYQVTQPHHDDDDGDEESASLIEENKPPIELISKFQAAAL